LKEVKHDGNDVTQELFIDDNRRPEKLSCECDIKCFQNSPPKSSNDQQLIPLFL
jgi:hypothetical protein